LTAVGSKLKTVLRIRDSGCGAFFLPLDPGSGMGKKSGSNADHISKSLETIFWVKILKFFDADPEGKNSDLGSGINIPDPLHC
jgi:hypothetical protein